ncbi:hypothetical protein GCM10023196_037630 [Actinoallomurus vinaceus]|uniref:Uncharacterized protein n=1 Tax=Actinoallomurus vinaceus TaxID=1080074 RepID=A0ABP8UBC8_9ACTN
MSWMDPEILGALRADTAELMTTIKRSDSAAELMRRRAEQAEQQASGARHQLEQLRLLALLAQGTLPLPGRDQIYQAEDGVTLAFGPLQVTGLPDDPTPEDYRNLAETMRSLYVAAAAIAHRAEEAARDLAAPSAPESLVAVETAEPGPGGESVTIVKRTCNGCGTVVGDAIPVELEADARGDVLPDVRGECAKCSGAAAESFERPIAGDAVAGRRLVDNLAEAGPTGENLATSTLTDVSAVTMGDAR